MHTHQPTPTQAHTCTYKHAHTHAHTHAKYHFWQESEQATSHKLEQITDRLYEQNWLEEVISLSIISEE